MWVSCNYRGNKLWKLYLLVIYIQGLVVGSQLGQNPFLTLTTNITFTHGQLVCPTPAVEFRCEGSTLRYMEWHRNETTIEILSPNSNEGLIPTTLTGVHLYLVSLQGINISHANISSVLIVEWSSLRSFDMYSCGNNDGFNHILIGELATLPPSIQYEIAFQGSADGYFSINLNWNNSFTNQYGIDEYCIQFSASINTSCLSDICIKPNTSYICPHLQAGSSYQLAVRATNCTNQYGTQNQPIIITPEIPRNPSMCKSVPVFDNSSGKLVVIRAIWRKVQNPREITSLGTTQDVLWYQLRLERDRLEGDQSPNHTVNVSTDACVPGNFQCNFSLTHAFPGSHYTLGVTAINVVGKSQEQPCTTGEIPTTNNIMVTSIITSTDGDISINCQFLTSTLATKCKVCIGSPSFKNLSCISPAAVNLNGMARIKLPKLQTGMLYSYTATSIVAGIETLEVIGQIRTFCSVSRLVTYFYVDSRDAVVDRKTDSRCRHLSPNITGSVRFPNGVVCLNGTTQGSMADYVCDKGYQVTDSEKRVCQHNGSWSGKVVICLPTAIPRAQGNTSVNSTTFSTFSTTTFITSIVSVAIASFIIGVILMTIIAVCFTMLKRKKIDNKNNLNPICEYYDEDHSEINTQALSVASQNPNPLDKSHTSYAVYEEIPDVIPQENSSNLEQIIITETTSSHVAQTSKSSTFDNIATMGVTEEDKEVTELNSVSCNIAYVTSQ